MGSDLFFVELTLRVFQNGLSVVGRLFVDIINILPYFTVLKSVKVVIATCWKLSKWPKWQSDFSFAQSQLNDLNYLLKVNKNDCFDILHFQLLVLLKR